MRVYIPIFTRNRKGAIMAEEKISTKDDWFEDGICNVSLAVTELEMLKDSIDNTGDDKISAIALNEVGWMIIDNTIKRLKEGLAGFEAAREFSKQTATETQEGT